MEKIFQQGDEFREIFVSSLVEKYGAVREYVNEDRKRFTAYLDLHAQEGVDMRSLSLHAEKGSFRDRARNVLKRLEYNTPEMLREIWG